MFIFPPPTPQFRAGDIWIFAFVMIFWMAIFILGVYLTPKSLIQPEVTIHNKNDNIPCRGLANKLYGSESVNGKQLADAIVDEFNAVADMPITLKQLNSGQLAVINYCQDHPNANLFDAVSATWRTL